MLCDQSLINYQLSLINPTIVIVAATNAKIKQKNENTNKNEQVMGNCARISEYNTCLPNTRLLFFYSLFFWNSLGIAGENWPARGIPILFFFFFWLV